MGGGGVWSQDLLGETAFLGGIFCLEYPSRRNEKVNCHFVNYRLSFRKLQIFISQTTDSHFVSFHFVSFRFVSFPCFLVIFCVLLGKAFKYCVQCFLVKCFSGVLKVQTKFGLQKHRWVWVAKILSNMAAEWFLQPNSPKYCMYRSWQPMTCYQNRLIPSLELAFSFGKRWIPSREPINLPLQRVVWDCFCISLKTNRTPVTQGVISWWENNASCLSYCYPHLR